MNLFKGLILVLCVFSFETVNAQEYLNPHLEPFRKLIGKTWKGDSKDPKTNKPFQDISKWERALNGQAIKIMHSVNNGEYGGETIIYWDTKTDSLIFYYFTTAGFYTHGTMQVSDNKFTSYEAVEGNENGITAVKSVAEILDDGRLHNKSMYYVKDHWEDGHEFYYKEDPEAEVIFK